MRICRSQKDFLRDRGYREALKGLWVRKKGIKSFFIDLRHGASVFAFEGSEPIECPHKDLDELLTIHEPCDDEQESIVKRWNDEQEEHD